jgi:hypothetical protein
VRPIELVSCSTESIAWLRHLRLTVFVERVSALDAQITETEYTPQCRSDERRGIDGGRCLGMDTNQIETNSLPMRHIRGRSRRGVNSVTRGLMW